MEFPIQEGKVTRITLSGKLDFARAPLLMDDISVLIGKDISSVVFDCADLTYISSAGIRALIFTQQKIVPDGEITMENVRESVREVLDICGLSDSITITESS